MNIDQEKLKQALHRLSGLTKDIQDLNKKISDIIKDIYEAIDNCREDQETK